jgi:hypothetical protein
MRLRVYSAHYLSESTVHYVVLRKGFVWVVLRKGRTMCPRPCSALFPLVMRRPRLLVVSFSLGEHPLNLFASSVADCPVCQ